MKSISAKYDFQILLLYYLNYLISFTRSSDILTACPTASYSHQQPFIKIVEALLQRNHSVTFITCNPEKIGRHEKLIIIDLGFAYDIWRNNKLLNLQYRSSLSWSNMKRFDAFPSQSSSVQWKHPNLRNFIQMIITTNKTYDLYILESWLHHSYWMFVDLIGQPPVISMATAHAAGPKTLAYSNPENPAYVPVVWTDHTDDMSFWQRVVNSVLYVWYCSDYLYIFQTEQQVVNANLDKKYIKRSLREIFFDSSKNSFLTSFDSRITGFPRPVQPKVIEVGPLHIEKPKQLDKELENWMNGAQKGVIYFSLGSNMKGTSLGDYRRKAFLKAFSRLPQYRVLWKWESDTVMEDQSDNVLLKKWMPQQDVIAHPKVKLFITQGGLQSLQEAYHYGVKLLCIPIFGDQDLNCAKIRKIKTGITLEFTTLNEEAIYNAIKTVLEDPIYEKNMNYYSALSKDSPMTPIEKSVWFIEYVLRHKGVAHLHSHAAELSLVQYFLIDVIGFFLGLLVVTFLILYFFLSYIIRKIKHLSSKLKTKSSIKKKTS